MKNCQPGTSTNNKNLKIFNNPFFSNVCRLVKKEKCCIYGNLFGIHGQIATLFLCLYDGFLLVAYNTSFRLLFVPFRETLCSLRQVRLIQKYYCFTWLQSSDNLSLLQGSTVPQNFLRQSVATSGMIVTIDNFSQTNCCLPWSFFHMIKLLRQNVPPWDNRRLFIHFFSYQVMACEWYRNGWHWRRTIKGTRKHAHLLSCSAPNASKSQQTLKMNSFFLFDFNYCRNTSPHFFENCAILSSDSCLLMLQPVVEQVSVKLCQSSISCLVFFAT